MSQTVSTNSYKLIINNTMNPNHYCDIERCKKLTEIGFPMTEIYKIIYHKSIALPLEEVIEYNESKDYRCGNIPRIVHPTVMEMLDVIPDTIRQDYQLYIWKNSELQYWVSYRDVEWTEFISIGWFDTLPNALADLIVWLHENNYIKF